MSQPPFLVLSIHGDPFHPLVLVIPFNGVAVAGSHGIAVPWLIAGPRRPALRATCCSLTLGAEVRTKGCGRSRILSRLFLAPGRKVESLNLAEVRPCLQLNGPSQRPKRERERLSDGEIEGGRRGRKRERERDSQAGNDNATCNI